MLIAMSTGWPKKPGGSLDAISEHDRVHGYITRSGLSRRQLDACASLPLLRLFGPDDLAGLKTPPSMAEAENHSGDACLKRSSLLGKRQNLVLKNPGNDGTRRTADFGF